MDRPRIADDLLAGSKFLSGASGDTPPWGWAVLVAILLAGAVLRLWGIGYGLPYIYYPDEGSVILRAMGIGSGDLNPHVFEYPAFMMYLLTFLYGLGFVAAYVTGYVKSAHDFALAFIKDPTYFFLCARVIVALAGVGTLWLTFVLGRRLVSWSVGLGAAALLAVHPVHVEFSHFMKLEVPQGFFVLLTLLVVLRILRDGTLRQYLLAGALAGICAALKYPGCLVFVAVFAAHAIRCWAPGRRWRILFGREIWFSGLAMVFVFLATNPFIVLDFHSFWMDFRHDTQIGSVLWIGNKEMTLANWVPMSVLEAGYVATIAGLAGILYYAIGRRREHLAVLAFLAVFFVMVGGQRTSQIHWLLPLASCASIFAVGFMWELTAAFIESRYARAVLRVALIGICLLEMTPEAIRQDRNLTLPDTRTEAKDWIEAHIPAGAVVLMDRGRLIAGYTAPMLMTEGKVRELYMGNPDAQGGVNEPPEFHARKYYELMIEATKGRTAYAIVPITHDVHAGQTDKRKRRLKKSFDDYVAQDHVEYVVTSDGYNGRYFAEELPPDQAEYCRPFVEFYHAIGRRCELLREFAPALGRRQGPVIRVYQVRRP